MNQPKFDVITMGRSSIDLYALEVGAAFTDIKSFAAYVGGSPTNIAVGTRRLGLNSALVSAVGEDQVGNFILHFLQQEGVNTTHMPRRPGKRSSAVVLGIEPPDKFPLVYYRDNAADIEISIDDVLQTPIAHSKILEVSGTGLCKEPSRSSTFLACEIAQQAGTEVVLDIDFRADQWHDPRAFGVNVRALLRNVDIALGTEEEINAAMLQNSNDLTITDQQISAPTVRGNLTENIRALLALGPKALVVKRGAAGATIHLQDGSVTEAPGYPVEIYNVLGAGDAFASGFIYGRVQGWDWRKAARLGNGCGAIVVTKHGCANFMPTLQEVMEFVDARGGL